MKLAGLDLTFHREGYVFIALAIIFTILFGFFIDESLFFIGLVITAWTFYFFRNPARITPIRDGLIVSPADGKVVSIEEVRPEESFGIGGDIRTRVSIFLNIFDVHVNRMPADGKVTARDYRAGKFFNAALDKASTDNERMAVALELTGEHPYAGKMLGVVQIAGMVARRIVCAAQAGETYKAGQQYGIIRFGSRVDIYLPPDLNPLVSIGQYMIGGETVIADAMANERPRPGARRD